MWNSDSLFSCFSSHFCFLVNAVLLVIMLLLTLLSAVSKPSLFFLMSSSSPCIDALTIFSMLLSPLSPSFLDTYSLSLSSLECKA